MASASTHPQEDWHSHCVRGRHLVRPFRRFPRLGERTDRSPDSICAVSIFRQYILYNTDKAGDPYYQTRNKVWSTLSIPSIRLNQRMLTSSLFPHSLHRVCFFHFGRLYACTHATVPKAFRSILAPKSAFHVNTVESSQPTERQRNRNFRSTSGTRRGT